MAKGTVIAGKYALEEPLAAGGMGSVWRARHLDLEVDVAIKLISLTLVSDPTALARFRREARSAAQLRSPHVVQILDYGVFENTPYIAMELLSGEDLDTAIQNAGRLPIARLKEIVRQVGKALRQAHDAGIVHRDLKPANIFLTQQGDEEIVKLLDFGIAKESQLTMGSTTGKSTLLGSPLYMSPEQVAGDKIDPRTDLWSLSVVLFEALTGSPPFESKGIGELFAKIANGPTPMPSERGVSAPGLDAFFERGLARDREKRFSSVAELVKSFDTVDSENVTATQIVSIPPARVKAFDAEAATVEAPVASAPRGREGDTLDLAASAPHASSGERTTGQELETKRRKWLLPALGAAAVASAIGIYAASRSGTETAARDASAGSTTQQAQAGAVTATTAATSSPPGPQITAGGTPSERPSAVASSSPPAPSAKVGLPIAVPPVVGKLPVGPATAAAPPPTVSPDSEFGISGTKKSP